MNQKSLLITALLIVLVGASYFLFSHPKVEAPVTEPSPVVEEPKVIQAEPLDTPDWQTYRNEEYGFEFKYPKGWEVQELMTAEIGLPIDCTQRPLPKECHNFTVRIFASKETNGRRGNVVLKFRETAKSDASNTSPTASVDRSETLEPSQWVKKIGDQEFVKTNGYFTIYSSCYTTAHISGLNIKNKDVSFETLYEVPGDVYVDEAEKYCSQEVKDDIFDHIVASFTAL